MCGCVLIKPSKKHKWELAWGSSFANFALSHYALNRGSSSFPSVSDSKESACQCRRPAWVWSLGQEDPWRKKWQPTPFLTGEFHCQWSLASYSPWGRKELDMVEQITQHKENGLPASGSSPPLLIFLSCFSTFLTSFLPSDLHLNEVRLKDRVTFWSTYKKPGLYL